jgi:hypothetical protein
MGRRLLTDEERLESKRLKAEKVKLDRLANPEKYKERGRLDRLKHKDKYNETRKQNRIENHEVFREKEKEAYIANRDKILERAKQDRKNNPDKYRRRLSDLPEERAKQLREYRKKYEEDNKEQRSLYKKMYRDQHKDVVNPARSLRRKNDPEYRSICNRWAKNNPDGKAAHRAKRRASKLKATPNWLTDNDWMEIRRYYKVASFLTKKTGIKYCVDHIHPLQGKEVCGLHVPWNLQLLTDAENTSKGNKLLD